MRHLILIRHSQTKQQANVNSHAWQLTDEGRKRCELLAEELRSYSIDRIVTSEEAKAALTGQLVADVLAIPCESAPNLHETKRETVGYFEREADFRASVQAAMNEPDKLLFGEETFTDARERLAEQLDTLLEQYPDETLAIVTHGTVMALFLAHISEQDIVSLWNSLDMPAYAVIMVSLGQKQVTKIVASIAQKDKYDSQSS
jgi:broad specificity phosphatase PhoE